MTGMKKAYLARPKSSFLYLLVFAVKPLSAELDHAENVCTVEKERGRGGGCDGELSSRTSPLGATGYDAARS